MKYKVLFGVLLGFLLHKVAYEAINLHLVSNFNECIHNFITFPENRVSPQQYCSQNLQYNNVEAAILYQPDFWIEKLRNGPGRLR
jgi:hypothetical protein